MNVRELLEKNKVHFIPSGRDYLIKCTNPEHDDSNPSMRVDQVLGIYQCMSCGHKGNLFFDNDEAPNKLSTARELIKRKINKLRAESIGLDMPENYMPYIGTWRGISQSTYQKFGAFKSALPQFTGRIVFPVRDNTGRIVVFQGRDELGTLEAKYSNWPRGITMPLFPTVEPIKGSVILVEGLFDMLNLHDKGLENAISIFGVNTLKESSIMTLKFQGVSEIVGILDPDEAGQRGAEKLKELCEEVGIKYKNVALKNGVDPGDLSKTQVTNLKRKLYD